MKTAAEAHTVFAMPVSSRLAVATHILTVMAVKEGVPVGSEDIAKRASTNAAVVRKIISMLGRAGITTSQPGAKGGTCLARSPEQITLLDIYRAVDSQEIFASPNCPPDAACPIGSRIGPVLDVVKARATDAMQAELAAVSIAEIAAKLKPATA
ncbi:Rrf2 family transcriptional regulator [Pseudahrensia aquimaris]|uniref:Rrf2 family transcriptional regulator n=1 Tax=Pseudahrensia aquimaris TaxID=744461 RepID=A0ABW3FC04_9HYPH